MESVGVSVVVSVAELFVVSITVSVGISSAYTLGTLIEETAMNPASAYATNFICFFMFKLLIFFILIVYHIDKKFKQ